MQLSILLIKHHFLTTAISAVENVPIFEEPLDDLLAGVVVHIEFGDGLTDGHVLLDHKSDKLHLPLEGYCGVAAARPATLDGAVHLGLCWLPAGLFCDLHAIIRAYRGLMLEGVLGAFDARLRLPGVLTHTLKLNQLRAHGDVLRHARFVIGRIALL